MRRFAAVVLALFAVAGCSATATSGDGASLVVTTQAPIVAPIAPDNVPGAESGTVFVADPSLVDTHPIPFTTYTVVGDAGDRLAVHFDAGNPECFGADATVTESPSEVALALHTGTRADAVGKMCIMNVVPATLEVQLATPLGGRTVTSR